MISYCAVNKGFRITFGYEIGKVKRNPTSMLREVGT